MSNILSKLLHFQKTSGLSSIEEEALTEIIRLKAIEEKFNAINTPEIEDFLEAVNNEALHQRQRWGSEIDAGKEDADWFWLIGYLAGKAIRPDTTLEKKLHHIITTAAALLNWHSAKIGAYASMRPGTVQPTSINKEN